MNQKTESCMICFYPLDNEIKCCRCGKPFHSDCLYEWYSIDLSCPNCRYNHENCTNCNHKQIIPSFRENIFHRLIKCLYLCQCVCLT